MSELLSYAAMSEGSCTSSPGRHSVRSQSSSLSRLEFLCSQEELKLISPSFAFSEDREGHATFECLSSS